MKNTCSILIIFILFKPGDSSDIADGLTRDIHHLLRFWQIWHSPFSQICLAWHSLFVSDFGQFDIHHFFLQIYVQHCQRSVWPDIYHIVSDLGRRDILRRVLTRFTRHCLTFRWPEGHNWPRFRDLRPQILEITASLSTSLSFRIWYPQCCWISCRLSHFYLLFPHYCFAVKIKELLRFSQCRSYLSLGIANLAQPCMIALTDHRIGPDIFLQVFLSLCFWGNPNTYWSMECKRCMSLSDHYILLGLLPKYFSRVIISVLLGTRRRNILFKPIITLPPHLGLSFPCHILTSSMSSEVESNFLLQLCHKFIHKFVPSVSFLKWRHPHQMSFFLQVSRCFFV